MFYDSPDTTLLYETKKGRTWQCDLTDKLFLEFDGMVLAFRVQDFFAFRRRVNKVDILEMIFDLSDDRDFEVIEAPLHNFVHRFALCELIQLRDLLNGTKFSLDLHSMLHEVLGSSYVVLD
jgi:hypothetical protein